MPEARRLMRLFVVGLKTAEAARKAGFTGQLIVAPDAKDLATAVIEKLPASAQLIYLAGRDRKPDLEMRCHEAERDLVALEVYEARAADYLSREAVRAFNDDAIDAVLHYSRRSAEIFLVSRHWPASMRDRCGIWRFRPMRPSHCKTPLTRISRSRPSRKSNRF